eukprot:757626-Hanusia_phi.AAC.1
MAPSHVIDVATSLHAACLRVEVASFRAVIVSDCDGDWEGEAEGEGGGGEGEGEGEGEGGEEKEE